jgi:hypothetical protein
LSDRILDILKKAFLREFDDLDLFLHVLYPPIGLQLRVDEERE